MKYRIVIAIFLQVFFFRQGIGADAADKIDFLKNALAQHEQKDTTRMRLLMELEWEFENMDSVSATHFDFLKEALDIAEKYKLTEEKIVIFNRVGMLYIKFPNYPKAMESYLKALEICDAGKFPKATSYTYMNIGIFHYVQKNYAEALKYYQTSLDIREKTGTDEDISTMVYLIGLAYVQQGEDSLAGNFLRRSLKMKISSQSKKGLAENYTALGKLYIRLEKFDSALYYLTSALKDFSKTHNDWGIAKIESDLADLYAKQKQWAKASYYASDAFRYFNSLGYPRQERMECSKTLADIYSGYGKPDSAYFYLKNYIALYDSIQFSQSQRDVANIEASYQLARKQSEIDLLNKDKKIQSIFKNAFVGGFILMALIALVLFNSFYSKKKANKDLENKNQIISAEKERSDKLLLNILPSGVAEELKEKGSAEPKLFEHATVMFTDFVNFTGISQQLNPKELVNEIHYCFKAFDEIMELTGMEKIKTIGDAYMAVCGLPVEDPRHAHKAVSAAIAVRDFIESYKTERMKENKPYFNLRVGVHSGPIVAGIVGVKKFAYDIWGDTVNTAARMEQKSDAGRINISGVTYNLIQDEFDCEYRGMIEAKNKGSIDMYFVLATKNINATPIASV
jgi:adenylate cyclase